MRLATVVDWKALREVAAASFVAGIGITAVFGLTIYGSTRFADLRREGHTGTAWLFGALAVVGLIVFGVAVALGIVVMAQKD